MRAATALFLTALTAASLDARALSITSAFDGGWFDPEHAGQGFTFEHVPVANGRSELLVYFSTFDIDGTPTLLVGQAPIVANVVQMTLNRPVVGSLPVAGVLPTPLLIPSGTLRIEMFGCGTGRAEFNVLPRPGAGPALAGGNSKIRVGTGSLNIQRLWNFTKQAQRCSGGISDDVLPSDQPESFEKFYTGSFVDARVVYEKRAERAELNFDLRNLPIGSYQLFFDDVPAATVESIPFRAGSRAQLRFTSPREDGTRLLDFDPRGLSVRIQMIGNAAISDQFRNPQTTQLLDTQPGFVGPLVGEVGNFQQSFGNTEVGGFGVRALDNFLLEASYQETGDAAELELTVENAVPGYYDVMVDNKRRGTVYVFERTGGVTYGRASFRKPVESGTYALDFDPRGQDIIFMRDGQFEFSARVEGN